jgi:hypothetical protein
MEDSSNQGNIYQLLEKVKPYWKKSRWFIPVFIILGALLGGYLYYKKSHETLNYYGKTSFMLSSDDVGSGGSISANLGIMLPGSSRGSNKTILLELLKSHKMIEKTLLSSAVIDGEEDLLVNHYIKLAGYRNAWKGNKQWENYSYPLDYKHDSSELRDGFLRTAAIGLANNYSPVKTDAGIFEISFFYHHQGFTKAFLDNLVTTIIDYYTEKKTAKANIVFNYAKRRYDNLYAKLNGKQRLLARKQDKSSEFVFMEDRVPEMKINRDIDATAEMLQEASKSLAAARMSLVNETPFIQIIDDVRLPLAKMDRKEVKFGIIGFVAGFLIPLLILIGIFFAQEYLKKQKLEYLKDS